MPLLSLTAATLFLAAAVVPSAVAPLGAERWGKRVVLVFAEPGGEEGLNRQLDALLADREGLAERDMLVLAVVGKEVSARFGRPTAPLDADALRQAYGIEDAAPFTMILIGKDGGEKLRRAEPAAAKDVFGLIDSMPMRRREAGG